MPAKSLLKFWMYNRLSLSCGNVNHYVSKSTCYAVVSTYLSDANNQNSIFWLVAIPSEQRAYLVMHKIGQICHKVA